MRTFVHVLVNTAIANLVTNFLWFALTFWVYLETQSILATGLLGGAYMLIVAGCSMWFGTIVDRRPKRTVMLISAWSSMIAFLAGGAVFFLIPKDELLRLNGPWLWLFTLLILVGCVVEIMRNLALSTTVTLLVPRERHANANGLVGTVQGLAFIATSVFSGLSVGLLGMPMTIVIAAIGTALPLIHLHALRIPEAVIAHDESRQPVDFRGGMQAMLAVPGLFALVLFSTFNNLGFGVFMALLDPYGLTLFTVEWWGAMFGLASTGFIVGGLLIGRFGLGKNPVRTLLIAVAALGVLSAVMGIRESPWLLVVCIWLFMVVMPAVEAAEQTAIQRVVPYERQGRVFGLAMTFEAAAAPITSIAIAPLAEFWIRPYMRTDAGQDQWEWLLGRGDARGIGLIAFSCGIAMLMFVLIARMTRSYRLISEAFLAAPDTGLTVSPRGAGDVG